MKFSLSWLRDYLKTTQTAEQLSETLTRSGIEVKSITSCGAAISNVVAAQILESIQHPNADRLSICKVDDGSQIPRQIVCGAKNYKVGDKVLLALPGAVLPGNVKIKVGKLRGVESEGMMCSSKELGLGEGAEGLHLLPQETIVGIELNELFPADDILELEITPNRSDWLGYLGVAREAAAFGAGAVLKTSLELPPISEATGVTTITAPNDCSFYSIRRIDHVSVKSSPSWLVRRLAVMGTRSINIIVDLANYIMFETAQPLHAFDADKIEGVLNVRFAHEGEELEALDGKTYLLRSSDLVVADGRGPQALAGIIGGIKSSITKNTSSILLESAVFNPATIAASLHFHQITTDAGYRFERGSKATTAMEASARATARILELAGGIASEKLFITGQLPQAINIPLHGDQVRQLLGLEMSDDQITDCLKKIGCLETKSGWQIPSWRSDLHRSVDLIEEVVRVHGIETLPARSISFSAPSSEADKNYDRMMFLRRRLAAAGLFEARTSTLVSKDVVEEQGALALRNPMGEQQSVLRKSLLPGLKKVLQYNLQHGASTVRLFELGKIYRTVNSNRSDSEDRFSEEESYSLGLVIAGAASPISWRSHSQRSLDFYDLKSMIDQLVPGEISYENWEGPLPPGMSLMLPIFCNAHLAGTIGLLHPAAARQLMVTGQEYPIAVAELDVAKLHKAIENTWWKKGEALLRFPAVIRDIALIVDQSIPYAFLEKSLLSAKEEFLKSVTPFDVFVDPSGEKIAVNKKSIGLTLKFQCNHRTLTMQEVQESCDRLTTLLKNMFGADVRT